MLKLIMKYPTLVLLTILLLSISNNTTAQFDNIDPKSVNIADLSDQQIEGIIKKLDESGMSDEDAMAMAQMRGASSTQISELMVRINQVRAKGVSPNTTASSSNSNKIRPTYYTDGTKISVKDTLVPLAAQETFGYTLFNAKNLTFEPSINIPTPTNYTLGIGDQIVVTVWGASQATYQLFVEVSGQINIPDIGPINVYGRTLKSVSNTIKAKLPSIYNGMKGDEPNTYCDVNLGLLRSIKVNVVGEVNLPGTYSVPATASAYNALYLSGGPNENGSFRKIQVIRDGKIIQTIDIYNFLLNGDLSDNINLKEDDIIYVSSFDSKVRLSGAFKRVGLFETLPSTSLGDIVEIAGGFSEDAYQNNLKVLRKTQTELEVKDVLYENFNTFILKNGDQITASELLNRYENRVLIEGHVFRPGVYELEEGMTLSALIQKSEGLREGAFTNRALITRLKKDNTYENIPFNVKDVLEGKWDIALQREDAILIKSEIGLKETEFIAINGLVKVSGKQPYVSNLTLSDVIFKAGGFLEASDVNSIEVARRLSNSEGQEYTDQLGHIFTFEVDPSLNIEKDGEDFIIEPFDIISVRKAPGFRTGGTVAIVGEVMNNGSFSIKDRGERISDLIARSGGLTPMAYPKGAVLIREKILTQEEIQLRQELQQKGSNLEIDLEDIKQVGIQLDKILKNPGGADDILLTAGDRIFIPRELQTVKVSGTVMNPISMTYKSGKRAKHFIKQAGGYGIRPKRSSVYVVQANGISKTTKNYILFKRYPKVTPGADILVPQRPESQMNAMAWIGLASAASSLAISVASLANILK